MSKLKRGALVLGLLFGGMALGQAFNARDIVALVGSPLGDSAKLADAIAGDYASKVALASSAPQITQVASEAVVRLEHLQARQNAEVIRLLTEIRNKK
ncbi:hypothetical protein K7W42_20270 [Deinococcus sp. HMF7604]|uniref:hypothetical protein n=1 Tax=Deinococcus betulae TaxID=2873312 RepID=UPI001CCD55D3|nr:hypothetical protein [Deinococcus betulae]MBZ9753175.1 hypothetical protein [Deinococcus betulae]